MSKNISRNLILWLAIVLIVSACPLISFLGDPIGYKFTGTINNSLDHGAIASVGVTASCEKSELDPPVHVFSDHKGGFTLDGYGSGALDDCQLMFEHPQFKQKILKLQPARELKEEIPFMRIWRLKVELEAIQTDAGQPGLHR